VKLSCFKRAAGAAALLLSLAHAAPALAQERALYPAIATGLAIPVGPARVEQAMTSASGIPTEGRTILVDAASATLFMMENGEVRDTMRVIVGKPDAATPVIRSTLYYATLNPFWNVPPDLAQTIIAPRVLKEGTAYLRERGYEVVSAFGDDARVLPASSVDWKAVAAGTAKVYVRQRPGPTNSMGRMKFGFANYHGIYLHDTPKKELFAEAQRQLSNGCVRLEDAPRLARWLLGGDARVAAAAPEQHVALPRPVEVVITYLDPRASTQLAALR
jgi:murein L,D-transpeptidase YcbB/YkuD